MRASVVFSSELLKRAGLWKVLLCAVLNRLKRAGSIGNFIAPGFEPIEKIGIRRRAAPNNRVHFYEKGRRKSRSFFIFAVYAVFFFTFSGVICYNFPHEREEN